MHHPYSKLQSRPTDVTYTTFKMSDPIHQRDISQSTLVSLKFISYFNSHFYTSIVIVTHEPFAFTPRERGKYSQKPTTLFGEILPWLGFDWLLGGIKLGGGGGGCNWCGVGRQKQFCSCFGWWKLYSSHFHWFLGGDCSMSLRPRSALPSFKPKICLCSFIPVFGGKISAPYST